MKIRYFQAKRPLYKYKWKTKLSDITVSLNSKGTALGDGGVLDWLSTDCHKSIPRLTKGGERDRLGLGGQSHERT